MKKKTHIRVSKFENIPKNKKETNIGKIKHIRVNFFIQLGLSSIRTTQKQSIITNGSCYQKTEFGDFQSTQYESSRSLGIAEDLAKITETSSISTPSSTRCCYFTNKVARLLQENELPYYEAILQAPIREILWLHLKIKNKKKEKSNNIGKIKHPCFFFYPAPKTSSQRFTKWL